VIAGTLSRPIVGALTLRHLELAKWIGICWWSQRQRTDTDLAL